MAYIGLKAKRQLHSSGLKTDMAGEFLYYYGNPACFGAFGVLLSNVATG